MLQHNPQIRNLDAVVGFLRASGYFSLRPFLDSINKVRVLIGIDVDKYIAEAARQGKLFFGAEDDVKQDCLRQIRKDIESSNYRKEIEDGMFQMCKTFLTVSWNYAPIHRRRFMPKYMCSILMSSINIPKAWL